MKSMTLRFGSFLRTTLGRTFRGWMPLVALLCASGFIGAASPVLNWFVLDKDKPAPVDWGCGPGKPIGCNHANYVFGRAPAIPKTTPAAAKTATANTAAPASVPGTAPVGGGAGGFFGTPFPWPIIPIHVALLPDGRVLNYGTDQQGNQGAELLYDVWTPSLGTGSNAHTVLPNTTATDIFCGAVSLLYGSGTALILGGDLTINGVRNYSNNMVELFTPSQNTLTASGQMTYARWYPSVTSLPNGDKLVLGGAVTPNVGEPTPEVRSATYGWRTLTGIAIGPNEWYYPKAFVGPDAAAYLFQTNGQITRLTTDSAGTMSTTPSVLASGIATYPSAMILDANNNSFSALTVRSNQEAQVVNFSQNPPVVTQVANLNFDRQTGQLVLLPDGSVLAEGGSNVFNDLTTAHYQSELFNRFTGTWTLGAIAAIPRLYHNTALLLPDATVLTAGGGAPGPINELNAEIYYPAYLYLKDGSGNPAPRPQVVSAPTTALTLNQSFSVTVGANDQISAVNLIRVGADTHNYNAEQRLIPLPFTQSGTQITATLNASAELAPPGYYMLFVLNTAGVPAVAPIISIAPTLPDLIASSVSYSSTTGLFTSVIQNQGNAATPTGVWIGVVYYVDGVACTWGGVYGPLAAGASVTIGTGGGTCPIANGTHTILVVVDNQDRIVELDKTNNTLSQTITVTQTALPDLVPTSLSYSSATGLFSSVIQNQGTAATPTGIWVGVAYYVDGVKCTWGNSQQPLAVNASVTIGTEGGACTIAAGTHTIAVLADDAGTIPESTTANNKLSETITVP